MSVKRTTSIHNEVNQFFRLVNRTVHLCLDFYGERINIWGLYNNYITLSCLYAKFHWLISHVPLSFQPSLVNVRRLRDSRRDTAVPGE